MEDREQYGNRAYVLYYLYYPIGKEGENTHNGKLHYRGKRSVEAYLSLGKSDEYEKAVDDRALSEYIYYGEKAFGKIISSVVILHLTSSFCDILGILLLAYIF